MASSAGVFRGVFPAASLKRLGGVDFWLGDRSWRRFPRGIPRGLIEAYLPGQRNCSTVHALVFRGVFPAASLKQHRAFLGSMPLPRRHVFRGVFPAASLKRRVILFGDASTRGRCVFRGVFPAASLKRRSEASLVRASLRRRFPRGIPRGLIEARGLISGRQAVDEAWHVFRGVFPAASLKQPGVSIRSVVHRLGTSTGFPRGIPRGLIEASLRRRRGRIEAATSFPRGIPRGLIEAAGVSAGGRYPVGGVRYQVFRGVFPAASLKRRADAPAVDVPVLGSVFRGVFPAASLKPSSRGQQRLAMEPVFPRGIPRGLIEAAWPAVARCSGWAVFRGVFPAASLKQGLAEVVVLRTTSRRFPRGIPRGLIEAPVPLLTRAVPWRVFRGVFPAASLKRRRRRRKRPDALRFPRGIPRGLIEAAPSRSGSWPGRGRFPRGIPRGLIEAWWGPFGRCRSLPFSAGYSPRPH